MRHAIADAIRCHAGAQPKGFTALGGGSVSDVYRVDFADRPPLVAKVGDAGSNLALEGFMLDYLATHSRLPVPDVVHAEDELLLIDWIESGDTVSAAAQVHAAGLLADLHGVAGNRFGFERTTLISGLEQPNPWTDRWIDFFAEHRLLHMGRQALDAGRLPSGLMGRLETIAGRLATWIEEPDAPSLLHGDLWTGNVLCREGRIGGFIDPAIYYGDAEIELAFTTLFGTFGEPFFDAYGARRPIKPGFFEERRDLYNLYPLLVHVRLFGGTYVRSVEATLKRYGC